MSNALLTAARKLTNVRGPAKAILIVLADRANERNECWPSRATLAADTGFSLTTVKKHLRALTEAGLVTRETRYSTDGDQDSNLYRLHLATETAAPGGSSGDLPGAPHDLPVGRDTPRGGSPRAPKASLNPKEEPKGTSDVEGSHSVELFISSWNERKTLPKVIAISPERRQAIRRRLRDPLFRDHWEEGMRRLEASDFCRGAGPAGWKATIDWFLKEDTLGKILEGRYDNRASPVPPAPSPINTGGRRAPDVTYV